MQRSKMVEEMIEWELFMKMFSVVKKEYNGIPFKVQEKGTLGYYTTLLNDVCSTPTKYKFLNKLVSFGALYAVSKIDWGGAEVVEYKIDKDKLYEVFRSTRMANTVFAVFDTYHIVV